MLVIGVYHSLLCRLLDVVGKRFARIYPDPPGSQTQPHDQRELRPESEGEEENRLLGEEDVGRESDSTDISVDDVTVAQNRPEDLTAGLRRRNRPE